MHPAARSVFDADRHFCLECGSVLPLSQIGNDETTCAKCSFKRGNKDLEDAVEEHIIYFNARKKKEKNSSNSAEDPEDNNTPIGPTVERECPHCNHDLMTYTTRQTRSADEGQTVFYSCLKCKFQDIEYS